MVGGGPFRLPHDLFRYALLYSIHFSSPVTICFKNGTFSLRFSRESHVEIRSRRLFFRLTYVETKHQSNPHNQAGANDFQRSIWISWVCQLSPTWYNTDCSQLLSRFDVINFNCSTRLWSIVQWEISSTKLQKPLLTCSISHSTFSIHCTNLFLCSVVFLPFLK